MSARRRVVAVRRDGAAPRATTVAPGPVRPLDAATRAGMESRFGHDFSAVRVHAGPTAARSASGLGAAAYTFGNDIVFGAGRYAPATRSGRRLLAHELAHVVQQRRGGGAQPSVDGTGPLERQAARAASRTGPVEVAGASGRALMAQPEHDDDDDDEASRRRKEKARDLKRRGERSRAGKGIAAQSAAEAEQELRALERSYGDPGAMSRSLDRKRADLKRYERLLDRTGATQLEKNRRKGAFDELQRTPGTTRGKPQTKHVAGGPALPGQDLRPGKESYAQPDYSTERRSKGGSLETVHVNLKSDKIDTQTVAKARATARAYLRQAVKNSRHLREGEKIVLSFARVPSKEVQEAMKRELFVKGSPVDELRFGSTTHRLADYKPPAEPPTPAKKRAPPKRKRKRAAKAPTAAKATKAPEAAKAAKAPKAAKAAKAPKAAKAAKAPKAAKAVKAPTAVGALKAPKAITADTAPRVAVQPVRLPTTFKPKALTSRMVAAKPVASTRTARAPRLRGGAQGGFRGGGFGAAGGWAMIGEGVALVIDAEAREENAEALAAQARDTVTKAIEGHQSQFQALIERRLPEIQAIQAEGREVRIHAIVELTAIPAGYGRDAMSAKVVRHELAFEDGPEPAPFEERRGWVERQLVQAANATISYEAVDIPLEGTDPEAARRRLERVIIDRKLQLGGDAGFEYLIIEALEHDRGLDDLEDYAAYRLELAKQPSFRPAFAEIMHWLRMTGLLEGSLEDLIAAARAKGIALDTLRLAAARREATAASAEIAAYWAEVVRLIDAR